MNDSSDDILLEILLKIDNLKDIKETCKSSKRFYNICKMYKETLAKHIIKNILDINKPTIFLYYKDFLNHYFQTKKNLHPEFNIKKWYHDFDCIMKNKYNNNSFDKLRWETKFGKIGYISCDKL